MSKKTLYLANSFLLLVCVFFFTINTAHIYGTSKKSIYAGTGKVNITPKVPIPMSGYSGRTEPFKGVHDDLFARAVVFSDGINKAVIISADLIGFSFSLWEEITKQIESQTGIRKDYILLCGTHTHGGPRISGYDSPPPEVVSYTKELTEKLVKVVKEGVSNLKSARIGAGKGECKMNINRRARLARGGIWLGMNPYGPVDREVGVVRIDDIIGNPMAIFINWACHGTVTGSKNYQITGDWPGAAERFVEKQFNNKVIAPVTAGASGDINPLYRARNSSFNTRVGEVEITGIYVGEEVVRVAKEITAYPYGSIGASQRVVTLPGKKLPPGPRFREDGRYTFEPGPNIDLRLSALKVGNIIFTGVSGEVMNEIGVKVKKQSPYKFTFVLTHCNGSSGYIVTDDAYPELGYEVVTSRIMSGGEKAIVENLLDMINEF